MSLHTEILTALTSAFLTGYNAGHSDGYCAGVVASIASIVLANALVTTVRILRALWKKRKSKARVEKALHDYAEFERQQSERKNEPTT